MPVDLEYLENRPGGVPNHENLMSIAKTEVLYLSTQASHEWRPAPNGEAARAVIPAVELEELIEDAAVDDDWDTWTVANGYGLLTTCVHVDALGRIFDFAGNNSVITDSAGNPVTFASKDEAMEAFQLMFVNHAGDPALQLDANDWDDLEPLVNAAALAAYGWIENLSVADLVKTSRTLATYVDFARIAGPRGLDAQRLAAGGQLRFACATTPVSNGGQLGAAIESYLGTPQPAGTGMVFLGKELPKVLEATQWEYPFEGSLPSSSDYALELPARSAWSTAGPLESPPLVLHRVVKALGVFDVLPVLLHSVMRRPAEVNTQLAMVGPAVLGKNANYIKQLPELEAALLEDYESVIKQGQAAGDSTQDLLKRIVPLAKKTAREDEAGGSGAAGSEGEISGPKRGPIRRALGKDAFVKLDREFKPILDEPGQPRLKTNYMFSKIFASDSIPPKAVLLATSQTRLHLYTDESTFLPKLADLRRFRRHYLAQCVAYDDARQKVPATLETMELDEETDRLFCAGKWPELDVLNQLVLRFVTRQYGATFDLHDATPLYHRPELIALVTEHMGKLFKGVGYPKTVPAAEGISYEDFMAKIKEISRVTMAMTEQECVVMFEKLDDIMTRALGAAALNLQTLLYGASPDTARVGAWLPAGEAVLREVNEMLDALEDLATFRNRLPIGGKVKARALHGLNLVGHGTGLAGPKLKTGKKAKGAGPATTGAKGDGTKGAGSGKGKGKGGASPLNLTLVYYYEDDTFSKAKSLYNWPGICAKYGWDASKYCGPYVMSTKADANKWLDCRDHGHEHNDPSHAIPLVNGSSFVLRTEYDKLVAEGLIVQPDELKAFKVVPPRTPADAAKKEIHKHSPPTSFKMVGKKAVYQVFHNGGKGF